MSYIPLNVCPGHDAFVEGHAEAPGLGDDLFLPVQDFEQLFFIRKDIRLCLFKVQVDIFAEDAN